MFEKRKGKLVIMILFVAAVAAAVGFRAGKNVVEVEQLRVVDAQGRLRYTIDTCITSYHLDGSVKCVTR